MKLDKNTTDIKGSLGVETLEAELSIEDIHKMWDTLQNPYKNSIGSIIREICSNSIDAHSEVGIDDAVRVKLSRDESGFYISFIDVGIGMSRERIDKVYRKYLKSTKENTNDQIGAYGRGSKSPLSYQDMFYINTINDGTEYKMIMRKGETLPALDILEINDTTERNGTEVKLYIKSEPDLLRFIRECFQQLHYFKNVVFDTNDISEYYSYSGYSIGQSGITSALRVLNDDYNLIEGEHFILRTNTDEGQMHLSIGNVKYPIDWGNLGMSPIYTKLALKFDIGELPVIQTREDIRYTDKAILTIKNKIKLLEEELVEKYNDQSEEKFNDLVEFNNYFNGLFYYLNFPLNNGTYNLDISGVVETDKLNPKQIKDFPYRFKSLKENKEFSNVLNKSVGTWTNNNKKINLIKFDVEKTFKINGSIKSINGIDNYKYADEYSINRQSFVELLECTIRDSYTLFTTKEKKYSVKKNKYIFNKLYPGLIYTDTYIISEPKFNISKEWYKYFKKQFSNVIGDKNIKPVIKYLLNKYKEKYSDILIDYDSIKVDEKWWKEYQAENKKTADYDRSKLAIDTLRPYNTIEYERKNYRPTLDEYLNDDHRIRILFDKSQPDLNKYMSNANDENTLLERLLLFNNLLVSRKYTKSKFIIQATSKRNYDKILKNRNENSNVYTLSEFMGDKKIQLKILGKVATLSKIKSFIKQNPIFINIFNYDTTRNVIFEVFNKTLQKDFEEIFGYIVSASDKFGDYLEDFDEINKIADIYDYDLIDKFNKLYEFVLETNIHTLENSNSQLLNFIESYKPKSSYFRLKTVFEKNYTRDELLKEIHGDISSYTEEEKVQQFEILYKYSLSSNHQFQTGYNTKKAVLLYRYFKQQSNTQLKIK